MTNLVISIKTYTVLIHILNWMETDFSVGLFKGLILLVFTDFLIQFLPREKFSFSLLRLHFYSEAKVPCFLMLVRSWPEAHNSKTGFQRHCLLVKVSRDNKNSTQLSNDVMCSAGDIMCLSMWQVTPYSTPALLLLSSKLQICPQINTDKRKWEKKKH